MTSVNINININTDISLFNGLGSIQVKIFFACHGIAQLHGNIVAFYCCIE